MDIIERIRASYPDLTKKQKAIANYLIANPEDICYITLAQLSQNTSACEVTLLRFCQKMGCASFLELKNEFRDYTQTMIKLVSSAHYIAPELSTGSASEKEAFLLEIFNEDVCSLSDYYSNICLDNIASIADTIRKSRRIYIFAHDLSKIMGQFLESRLKILYLNATLVDLGNLEETQFHLQNLAEEDLAILFSFPRYFFPIGNIARKISSIGIPILAITDSDTSPVAKYGDHLLLCPGPTKFFYNSLALPMAVLNLLASCLVIDNVAPSEIEEFKDTLPS